MSAEEAEALYWAMRWKEFFYSVLAVVGFAVGFVLYQLIKAWWNK